MVQLLLQGRHTAGELAEDCAVPDNVASEHLRLMLRCGFLTSEREGRKFRSGNATGRNDRRAFSLWKQAG